MGKNSIYPTNTHIKRKTMTPAALAANRANAARGGRPVGVMDAQRLSFRDRCRRNDERHVEILVYIVIDGQKVWYQVKAVGIDIHEVRCSLKVFEKWIEAAEKKSGAFQGAQFHRGGPQHQHIDATVTEAIFASSADFHSQAKPCAPRARS